MVVGVCQLRMIIKDVSSLKEKMLKNRSELKVLKAQKRAVSYSYKAAAANYYPKVDAEAKLAI